MKIEFEEAVEWLEDGLEVNLHCEGYEYEVSGADNWLGGEGMEGFISQVMGNTLYSSAERVLRESINHLSDNGKHEVEIYT